MCRKYEYPSASHGEPAARIQVIQRRANVYGCDVVRWFAF